MSDKMREALELFMQSMDRHGNWDDGCFYYGATSASEFQRPMELARAALAAATPSRPGTAGAEDSRVYFICQSCETENPEGAVSCRSDIAVMPDGTWLCSGCYSDCEKTAYGLVANDIDDFEFLRFEDLPRPTAYPADPAVSPQDGWCPIEDAPVSIRAFAKAIETDDDRNSFIEYCGTIEDGRPFVLMRKDGIERVFDRYLILPHYALPRAERKPDICTFPACGPNCSGRKG